MKRRIADSVLVTVAGLLIFGFGIGVVFSGGDDFSEEENRMLATLDTPTIGELADGSFFAEVGEFYRDRFPARQLFTRGRTLSELSLLRMECNGVVFGKDGYLLPKGEYDSYDIAEKNAAYLSELMGMCEDMGRSVVCAAAPRPIDVMTDKLPVLYGGEEERIWEILYDNLEYIDLTPRLREAAGGGADVWYKTDHHWTTEGAYIAYLELSRELGYTPYGEDSFTRKTVSEDFLGSSYSLGGCVAFSRDSIELYRYEGDGEYTVRIDGAESGDRIYFEEQLDKKDKYGVFLGGNYARLEIEDSRAKKRERLLIFKDSYANSLAPFLARHYDIEMIDLRYFEEGRDAIAERISAADRVLFLHGVDTLATTSLY